MTSQFNFKSKDAATFNRVSPKLKMSRILFWILLWINLFGQVFPVKPIFDLANNMRLVCTIINLQRAVLTYVTQFLKWQPCHFPVMVFWFLWAIYLVFSQCLLFFSHLRLGQ